MHYAMNTDYSQLSPLFPLKTSLPQINGCIVTGTGRQQTAVTVVSAHDPDPWLLVLETKAIRTFAKISQSRRRPLLGPSPG